MYTTHNYKTKKALKQAISEGKKVAIFQPGPFVDGAETENGTCYLEGPHYPEPHRWYAQGTLRDGYLIRVK